MSSVLIGFTAISLLLVVTPGPDMAVVTRNALVHGTRAVLLTTSGIALALLGWVTATTVGVGALVQASGQLFFALRLAGGLYPGLPGPAGLGREPTSAARVAGVGRTGAAGIASAPGL